jgi:hypothetical protein
MAKGSSGSDKGTKRERIANWRKTRAAQRQPVRIISQQEAGTPF